MPAVPTTLLIDTSQIFASLYHLAAVIFGSQGLANLSTGDDRDEFDRLRVRHETGQATKLLIETAVVLRNFIDSGNWPRDVIHESRIERRPETNVGTIKNGNEKIINLDFREACNKIIHAKHISFGLSDNSERLRHLNGVVKLHGDRQSKEWVAEIILADFIRMAVRQL